MSFTNETYFYITTTLERFFCLQAQWYWVLYCLKISKLHTVSCSVSLAPNLKLIDSSVPMHISAVLLSELIQSYREMEFLTK